MGYCTDRLSNECQPGGRAMQPWALQVVFHLKLEMNTMDLTRLLLDAQWRRYLKLILLVSVSYFFLGISEGAFFSFSTSDTLINFAFTLFCVGSSWVVFKALYPLVVQKMGEASGRLWLAALVMVVLLSVYITLLNWTYIELLWMEQLGETLFFSIVLPLAVALFLGLVLLYPRLQEYLARPAENESIRLEVTKGREKVFVAPDEVLGFIVESKLTFLVTRDGQKYLAEQSLTELETLLVDKGFFRANRQLLLVKAAVTAYKPLDNEKIQLSLQKAFGEACTFRISRYKAPAFRQWMAP